MDNIDLLEYVRPDVPRGRGEDKPPCLRWLVYDHYREKGHTANSADVETTKYFEALKKELRK